MYSSTGSAISSVNAPQVRTCGILNEDIDEEGYHSDGECRPFYDAAANSSNAEEVSNEQVNTAMPSNFVQHTIDDIRKMAVNQLEQTFGSMNHPKSGNKAILVDRLIEAVQNQNISDLSSSNTKPTPTPSSPWELLVLNSIPARSNANNRYTDPISIWKELAEVEC